MLSPLDSASYIADIHSVASVMSRFLLDSSGLRNHE